jgi:hypothetical protein
MINAQTNGYGFYWSKGARMKWVSYRIPIALAAALFVSTCSPSQVASSASSDSSQGTTHHSRAETNSAAKIFVVAYDSLVAAAFKAAVMENSPNVRTKRKGIGSELAARERFDAVTRSLPISLSAKHHVLKVVASDHRIEVDLGHLESKGKGIVNGDPLNFYIAVAALAKYLGVETKTWPPVTPAGPTAGD